MTEQSARRNSVFLLTRDLRTIQSEMQLSKLGSRFLGTEYVANTLEINSPDEKLVTNLTGLDCVTFVENCLTFARCLKKGKTSFDDYKIRTGKYKIP